MSDTQSDISVEVPAPVAADVPVQVADVAAPVADVPVQVVVDAPTAKAEPAATQSEPPHQQLAAGVALDAPSSELTPVETATATNELTENQKKAVASLLEKTTELAKSLVQDGSLGPLGVTKLIASLMKNAEGLQVDGAALKGSDKKKVVLEVGKQIINTYVTGEHKATVASLYDGLAEPTLEAMIDMSRGVNFTTAAMHIINDKEAQVAVVNAIRGCGGFKCC